MKFKNNKVLSVVVVLSVIVVFITILQPGTVNSAATATPTVTLDPATIATDLQSSIIPAPTLPELMPLTASNIKNILPITKVSNVFNYHIGANGTVIVTTETKHIDIYSGGNNIQEFILPPALPLTDYIVSADGIDLAACDFQKSPGSLQKNIWIWTLENGHLLQTIGFISDPFIICALSPDHSALVILHQLGGQIQLLDVASGHLSTIAAVPSDYQATDVAFGPSSSNLLFMITASCPKETNHGRGCGETTLWNMRTQQRLPIQLGQFGIAVQLDTAGKFLVTATCHLTTSTMDYCRTSTQLELWDLSTGQHYTFPGDGVRSFQLSTDSTHLASLRCVPAESYKTFSQDNGCAYFETDFWDVTTRKKLFTVRATNYALSPDGKLLATVDNSDKVFQSDPNPKSQITFIDTATGVIGTTVDSETLISDLSFSSDGKILVTMSGTQGKSDGKTLSFWGVRGE